MTTPPPTVRRVLICEDSQTYAAGLTRLLERDPEIQVVGVCDHAEQAIARLASLKPDLVTMDLGLPGMSGAEAIEQIMSVLPVPILVLTGQRVEPESDTAIEALAAGALDCMSKIDLDVMNLDGPAACALRRRVKILCGVRVIRHPRGRLSDRRDGRPVAVRSACAIGIAASTGGPPALAAVLAELPATFPIPIVVVQHMSPGFLGSFATWLDSVVPLPVRMAVAGVRLGRGVWVAPEGAHLVLTMTGRVAFDDQTMDGPHRPSGDMLLRSMATRFGRGAVAVVLSGMGRDGAAGIADVQRAGGLTITQDEATSAVWGMPRAAAESGAACVLPLQEISGRLRALRLEESA